MDVSPGQRKRKGMGVNSLAVALTIALSCALSSVSAAGPKAYFNIPPGTLEDALRNFGHQAHVTIVYGSTTDSMDAEKVMTRVAVVGELELAEALRRILDGTGLPLTFEFVSASEVIVKPRTSPALMQGPSPVGLRAVANREGRAAFDESQEVTVTGSLIRGLESITAPVMVASKKDIQKSAYGTVQDVLRSMPQTFGGGPSEDFSTTDNFMRGSSVDLRGLGSGATLLLVNGRRQPVSSIDGNFVDVSTIPWSAVDRIEMLTDGASALYGSDAIAGVVNVIMREELPGMGETQLRMGNSVGGADEQLLSQSLGQHGDRGKWMLTYQYSRRTALASTARRYSASDDKRPFGGSDLRSIFSSPGNILNPATQRPAFGIGRNGELSNTINLYDTRATIDLLPDSETHSAFFAASQQLGERFEWFAEGRFGHRYISAANRPLWQTLPVPASNPYFVDPFGGSSVVLVTYNFLNDLGPIQERGASEVRTGTLGVKIDLRHEWQATLSGALGQERMRWLGYNQANPNVFFERLGNPDPALAFNPFGAGVNRPEVLEAIRFADDERAVSRIQSFNMTVDGALPSLPFGTPKLAAGLDLRRELLERKSEAGPYERRIDAGFVELSIPAAPNLTISLASRFEKYSDFGQSFNPKIGLRWKANNSLRLRGSWSTSFRAPTLVNAYDRSQDAVVMFVVPDPLAVSGYSTILLEQGNNPHLHEETAKTWTAGIDFAPAFAHGLTFSGTYYSIFYDQRILAPTPATTSLANILADPQWSAFVRRNPARAEIERICNASRLFLVSRGDCLASSPAALLDVRLQNFSSTKMHGVDLQLEHTLRTELGLFGFGLSSASVFSLRQDKTHMISSRDLAGMALNIPTTRLRGTAEWYQHGENREGLGVSLALNHLTGSRDYDHPPVTHIPPWTTLDLQLSYQTPQSAIWLSDMEWVLNAANLFDRDPPFVNREEGYDRANADPAGRVISFTIRKSW